MILSIVLLLFAAANCCRLTQEENELLQKSCGATHLGSSSTYKIFGGRYVKPGEYPFMVKIRIFHELNNADELCSGALISPRHVLTAAHCVALLDESSMNKGECDGVLKNHMKSLSRPVDFTTYVGTRCLSGWNRKCKSVHSVSKIFIDKEWKLCVKKMLKGDVVDWLHTHDIAILELSQEVSNKDAIPICLPQRNLPLAKELQVTGNGKSHPVWMGGHKVATVPFITEDPHEVLLGKSNISATCAGDSGGPLFQLNDEGRYVEVGVTTGYLIGPHKCDKPVDWNYFADVRKSVDWICQTTGVCPDGQSPKEQANGCEQNLYEGLKKLIVKIGNAGRDGLAKARDFLKDGYNAAWDLIQG